MTEENIF